MYSIYVTMLTLGAILVIIGGGLMALSYRYSQQLPDLDYQEETMIIDAEEGDFIRNDGIIREDVSAGSIPSVSAGSRTVLSGWSVEKEVNGTWRQIAKGIHTRPFVLRDGHEMSRIEFDNSMSVIDSEPVNDDKLETDDLVLYKKDGYEVIAESEDSLQLSKDFSESIYTPPESDDVLYRVREMTISDGDSISVFGEYYDDPNKEDILVTPNGKKAMAVTPSLSEKHGAANRMKLCKYCSYGVSIIGFGLLIVGFF